MSVCPRSLSCAFSRFRTHSPVFSVRCVRKWPLVRGMPKTGGLFLAISRFMFNVAATVCPSGRLRNICAIARLAWVACFHSRPNDAEQKSNRAVANVSTTIRHRFCAQQQNEKRLEPGRIRAQLRATGEPTKIIRNKERTRQNARALWNSHGSKERKT